MSRKKTGLNIKRWHTIRLNEAPRMNSETSEVNSVEGAMPTSYTQEVRGLLNGHVYMLQVDSSLNEFRLPAGLRPFTSTKVTDVVLEIKCTDGMVRISAKSQFVKDDDAGALYRLFDLRPTDRQILYNHFDNLQEGIEVSRAMLAADNANAMEERDFQLTEKNREVAKAAAPALEERVKQGVLSGFFLIVIGFFGWLLLVSLVNIVREDWGQQEYYNRVSQARLAVASMQLRQADAKMEFTRSMLAKMQDPVFRQGVSPIEAEVFKRDLNVLEAQRAEMMEVVNLLKVNRAEVAKGNFFYERRVLDNFSTQDRQTASSSGDDLLSK